MEEVIKEVSDAEKTVQDAVPAALVVDEAVDSGDADRQKEPEKLISRMEYVCRWNGLPRALVVELVHTPVPKEEMDKVAELLSKTVQSVDLASASDEATLVGVCRWFARRAKKLLQERVVSATVLWKPEICTVETKDV